MQNKRSTVVLCYSFRTQHLQGHYTNAGARLPFAQNHHHAVLTILPCLPSLLLGVLMQHLLAPTRLEVHRSLLSHRHRHSDLDRVLPMDLVMRCHPSTMYRVQPTATKSALSRMVGNVVLIQMEGYTMLITTPVLHPGNVLLPHQKLLRNSHRHLHPAYSPIRHNYLVPVGFMPTSHYRRDGRNAALLREDHTSWIIARGRRHGTIRDRPKSPSLPHRPPLLPMPPMAHSHLDGKCA